MKPSAESFGERNLVARWRHRWPLLMLIAVGAVYLSTLAVNHSEAEDSLWYLRVITYDTLEYQFHPNHLIYNYVVRLFFRPWQLLGIAHDAERPAQILNVLGGLAVLWLVFRLARRLEFSPGLASLATLTIAFSYGFWWYSVECETYILPILFVLLCLHRCLDLQTRFHETRHHVLLGIWSALAVLFHQQHVLLILVMGIGYLWLLRRKPARWLRQVLIYGAVSGVLILGSYVFVAVVVEGRSSLQEVVKWCLSGGRAGGYGYGLTLGSLKALFGLGRAFIGAHFLLAIPAVAQFIQRAIPNYEVAKFVYLVKDQSPILSAVLLALTLTAAGAWGAVAVRLLKCRNNAVSLVAGRALASPRRFAFVLFVAYLVVYGVFNTWYLPESVEVWISLVPIAVLTGGLLLRELSNRSRSVRLLLGVGVACLFVVNLFGSVLPQTTRDNDYWFQASRWLIENTGPGDLVVSGAGYIADGYVAFYAGSKVLTTSSDDGAIAERIEKAVRNYQPTRILISSTVHTPVGKSPAQARANDSPASIFFESIRSRLTLLHADAWQEVYLYRR